MVTECRDEVAEVPNFALFTLFVLPVVYAVVGKRGGARDVEGSSEG